jgi:hypothetical protein
MTAALKTYHLYTVGFDGKYAGLSRIVECADDREAVAKAMQTTDGIAVEIWEAKKIVARLPRWPTARDSKKNR